ncbi:MAG TPA: sigma-70 family RNA polymerase sigma factor [Actinomycetes bacterium]
MADLRTGAPAVRHDFARFFGSEYRAVLRLAYALTGEPAAAEDIAQDAFLAALRHWPRVAGYADAGAWVRRVAANLAVSRWRRLRNEARALTRLAAQRPTEVADLPAPDAAFWAAVRALPRRQAQVIALHYLEDRPVAEVAVVLGLAEGTVKSALHAGRRTLAVRLDLEVDR